MLCFGPGVGGRGETAHGAAPLTSLGTGNKITATFGVHMYTHTRIYVSTYCTPVTSRMVGLS